MLGGAIAGAGCDGVEDVNVPPSVGGGFFGPIEPPTPASGESSPPLPFDTAEPALLECGPELDAALANDAVLRVPGKVLYTWITADAAMAYAQSGFSLGGDLASHTERFRSLSTATSVAPFLEAVAASAQGALTTWPRAWATRVGLAINQPYLLQVTLREDALWETELNGEILLLDRSGKSYPLETEPDQLARIAGVFYGSGSAGSDQSTCGEPFLTREVVLTNPQLVDGWAIGTDAVVEHVEAEVVKLATLLEGLRGCTLTTATDEWIKSVACAQFDTEGSVFAGFEGSLAAAKQEYYPSVNNLAHLINTLNVDLRYWVQTPIVAGVLPQVSDAGSDAVVLDAGDGGELDAALAEAFDSADNSLDGTVSEVTDEQTSELTSGPVSDSSVSDSDAAALTDSGTAL